MTTPTVLGPSGPASGSAGPAARPLHTGSSATYSATLPNMLPGGSVCIPVHFECAGMRADLRLSVLAVRALVHLPSAPGARFSDAHPDSVRVADALCPVDSVVRARGERTVLAAFTAQAVPFSPDAKALAAGSGWCARLVVYPTPGIPVPANQPADVPGARRGRTRSQVPPYLAGLSRSSSARMRAVSSRAAVRRLPSSLKAGLY